MSTTRQIGEVETSLSEDSIRYTAKFFVPESEADSFSCDIYEEVDWAPLTSVIRSVKKTPVGPHWLISITAGPRRQDLGSFETESPDDTVLKSFGCADFYFDPLFWGIREASRTDVENEILNIADTACRIGDYLFRNATDSSRGAADYTYSPFSSSGIGLDLIGQTVKTIVYCCTFYSTRNASSFQEFVGVNGSFAAKCRPATTTAGTWKAENQEVDTYVHRNGVVYSRVYRKMAMAPCSLKWDPDKNGGTWSW